MNNIKSRPRPGEIWLTKKGYQVRILAGRSSELIEAAYLSGRIEGRLGINFEADTLKATRGDDELVGKA